MVGGPTRLPLTEPKLNLSLYPAGVKKGRAGRWTTLGWFGLENEVIAGV